MCIYEATFVLITLIFPSWPSLYELYSPCQELQRMAQFVRNFRGWLSLSGTSEDGSVCQPDSTAVISEGQEDNCNNKKSIKKKNWGGGGGRCVTAEKPWQTTHTCDEYGLTLLWSVWVGMCFFVAHSQLLLLLSLSCSVG